MKTMDFVSLVLGIVGFLVLGIGMCMCLIKEWGMFKTGVVVAVIGAVLLIALAVLRWNLAGCPTIHVNVKLVLKVVYCVASVLVFGSGMSMALAMNKLVPGLVTSVIGIVMMLGMIPMTMGLK